MAFISEIHYQDGVASSTGIGEYVEVSLTDAEYQAGDAANFAIVTYNPDGTEAGYEELSSITPVYDAANDLWVYQFDTITTAPDNSNPNSGEGIMLLDISTSPTTIVSFYEITPGTTTFTPVAGSAAFGAQLPDGSTPTTLTAESIAPISSGTQNSVNFDIYGNVYYEEVTEGEALLAVCFANGTQIETPDGFKAIEDLRAGDLVQTKDAGCQPIRWIGSRTFGVCDQIAEPRLRAVVIPVEGAAPLRVSRQHRILVTGIIAQRMFGKNEVLVPAKDLIGHCGVHVDQGSDDLTYFHILLDEHHLLNANGIASESLYLGREGINAMTAEARDELTEILPDIARHDSFVPPALCRTEQTGRRARLLADRSDKNGKELVALF